MFPNLYGQKQQPEQVGFCSQRLARITPWLENYVDEGKIPFGAVVVMRKSKVAYSHLYGLRDVEKENPAIEDGLYRIYSMSKLITTVVAMSLFESGELMLDDPISMYIPQFLNQKVYLSGSFDQMELTDLDTPMTIHHLLNHTSGLTYGAFDPGPVGRSMRKAKIDFGDTKETLEELVNRLAKTPLCFQPGSRWKYGVSTDVLGRIIEVITGKSLETVFKERVFYPLKMSDTFFSVPDDKLNRFGALYTKTNEKLLKKLEDAESSRFRNPLLLNSGGGGLVSSMNDYIRFIEMIRGLGKLDGVRVLGRKTVEFMMRNHLPGDMASMGQKTFSEMPMTGIGFGLGGAVLLDPVKAQILGSEGEFTWGGVASTAFWIDPLEEISAVFMTQLIPSSTYPIRRELRVLVYQALID
jgi:CubicO group peptidase (beta-lactamase class C family)